VGILLPTIHIPLGAVECSRGLVSSATEAFELSGAVVVIVLLVVMLTVSAVMAVN
jgi:hypothetical protein